MNKSYFKRELLFFLLAPGFIFAVAGYNKKASVQLFKQILKQHPTLLTKKIHSFVYKDLLINLPCINVGTKEDNMVQNVFFII